MKLSQVIDELVEERGIERDILTDIVVEGMLAAYMKKYPTLDLSASYNRKSDDIVLTVKKAVVQTPENDDVEVSLRKARALDEKAELGQVIELPFDGKIGRIEILKAKQIIAQKIRTIEAAVVYEEFKPREGTIVNGVVHKFDRNGATIKLQDAFAFLPRSLTLPDDRFAVGFNVRALLKEVLTEPRNENQLILDRTSPEFVMRLFELEIPEIFERLVEIKKIVREPGYKTKMIVASRDENIDPVGTCVGVGGARIKPILREIGSEKVDIIGWTPLLDELVARSLKPAVVNRVELANRTEAVVWVDEDQRSVAIGKMGKNISLASQLTGIKITLAGGDVKERAEEMLEHVVQQAEEDSAE